MAKVRLKATLTIGFQNYLAGEIIELTDEQAEELIKRELVERIEEEVELSEKKPKSKPKGGK
ncbi:MAG: hypothetical protein ACPLPS_06205 [bacterium]